MKTFFNERIIIETGDITQSRVDAVVNAANSSLMGGGGVDGAIHRKGGPDILRECKDIRQHRYPQGLPPGKAVITAGGLLPASYVIHTVGPVWKDGEHGEKETLVQAYVNSLNLARETGVNSIAFPAISTGVYGFPREIAAPLVFSALSKYITDNSMPREVRLVFFSEQDMKIFLAAINTGNMQ